MNKCGIGFANDFKSCPKGTQYLFTIHYYLLLMKMPCKAQAVFRLCLGYQRN